MSLWGARVVRHALRTRGYIQQEDNNGLSDSDYGVYYGQQVVAAGYMVSVLSKLYYRF